MTTASLTASPEARIPAASAAPSAAGRLSFDGVLRGEWIKLLSLRSIRWSVLVMLVLSWAGAALMASAIAGSGSEFVNAESMPQVLAQSATFGSNITVLIMGVIGVLAVTSEYASGLILSSLSAVPSRTPLLVAKALVVAALAAVVGGVSTFGGGLIAALILGDGALGVLFQGPVLASMLGTTVYLALAALLSLGVGALLRSTAGAISVVVVLLFVSTIVLQILSITGWAWVPEVAQWMPADLGHQLSTAALAQTGADASAATGVGYWAALGGLAVWAAAALIPAAILLKTRDAV
jgi:ABC-2 type transport system permease protein